MKETILEMNNICKTISGVQALKNVHFDLKSGEIHALMGENGAGKSTLMNVLTGNLVKNSGTVTLFGKDVNFTNIRQSQALGIGMIHQELEMMNHLTVAQNIFIGREPMKNKIFINDTKMAEDARVIFKKMGVNIDPYAKLGDLSVGKQQMVEIAKALSVETKLLILDEPTAALAQSETEDLFSLMRDLKAKGIGMIFISHRMDEIEAISDRVTVMRDGEYIKTLTTSETTRDEIVKLMVGRVIYGEKKECSNVADDASCALEVKNLNSGKFIRDISFKLRKGEILGFAGLVGAGRTEVVRAIYGADSFDSGEIFINGKNIKINSPYEAVKNGVCYLSEDRHRFGLMLKKSVADNTVLSSLDKFEKFGVINDKKAECEATEFNKRLKTKMASISQPVKNLSGGNQQKVIIARWLMKNSDIIIFDEPTRGIDIGAKSEIYKLIEQLAENGKSIILISSELAEIQRLSDRVIVMCEGKITATLDISEATQKNIMKYATMRDENYEIV